MYLRWWWVWRVFGATTLRPAAWAQLQRGPAASKLVAIEVSTRPSRVGNCHASPCSACYSYMPLTVQGLLAYIPHRIRYTAFLVGKGAWVKRRDASRLELIAGLGWSLRG